MAAPWLAWSRRPLVRLVALLVFAVAFLGARGIWDPDEGRYTNVALHMVDSGDWLTPHRSDDVAHWTKPPMTYWVVGASLATFGPTAFAARLPVALAYVICTLLAWRIARRLSPGTEDVAAVMYATMLLPWIASQLVTTDFLVSMFETLAIAAYVEGRWGRQYERCWYAVMWVAWALAFLTKGPPALLPLLAVALAEAGRAPPRRAFNVAGIVLFVGVASAWFVAVALRTPGLVDYWLGHEVVGRVASDQFNRNGQWYGWLVVYAPTLLIGTLPWTPWVARAGAAQLRRVRSWREARSRDTDAPDLLLLAWWLAPLIVFCVARSRLPLYVLPLFVAFAVGAATAFVRAGRTLRATPLVAWCAALLALRIAGAYVPSTQDASQWASAVRARVPGPIDEVVFVETTPRYGLHLELGAEVETIAVDKLEPGTISPEFDEDLGTELGEATRDRRSVWLVRTSLWPTLRNRVTALGYDAVPLGTAFRDHVIFQLREACTAPPCREAAVRGGR